MKHYNGEDTHNVIYADLIIQGEIISIEGFKWSLVTGTAIDEKIQAMSDNRSAPEFPFTKYLVKISDVYFGEANVNQVVEYVELGGLKDSVTKPQDKGQVILFLDKHVNGYYVTAIMEHSIFAVDASERLYAFSNQPGLSAYDGKPVDALVKDIRAEVKAIKQVLF